MLHVATLMVEDRLDISLSVAIGHDTPFELVVCPTIPLIARSRILENDDYTRSGQPIALPDPSRLSWVDLRALHLNIGKAVIAGDSRLEQRIDGVRYWSSHHRSPRIFEL